MLGCAWLSGKQAVARIRNDMLAKVVSDLNKLSYYGNIFRTASHKLCIGLLNDYRKFDYRNFLSLSFSIFSSRLSKSNIYFWALSRISPRVRVRDSVSIVYRIAPGGYSWIWPIFVAFEPVSVQSYIYKNY